VPVVLYRYDIYTSSLKKLDMNLWIGCIWLRVGTRDRLLFWLHMMQGIS